MMDYTLQWNQCLACWASWPEGVNKYMAHVFSVTTLSDLFEETRDSGDDFAEYVKFAEIIKSLRTIGEAYVSDGASQMWRVVIVP